MVNVIEFTVFRLNEILRRFKSKWSIGLVSERGRNYILITDQEVKYYYEDGELLHEDGEVVSDMDIHLSWIVATLNQFREY